MKKQLLLFAVSSVFMMNIASTAWAGTYNSVINGGWREQEAHGTYIVWNAMSYPGSSDSATINSSHTVTITNDESVAGFNFSGVLDLNASHNFTVLTTGLVSTAGATNQNGTSTGHFNNYGTISADGNLHMGDTPFENKAGAVFDIRNDISITAYGGGSGRGAFLNYGTLRKSGGPGVSELCRGINVGFENIGGTIEVLSGTLRICGVRTSTSGTFKVSSGAVLDLTGPAADAIPRYNGIYTGQGEGIVQLTNGTMTVSATTLNFTNDMFRWQGGTVAGSFSNIGRVWTEGVNTKTLDGGNIDNYGAWNHRGSGSFYLNEAVFSNYPGAVFDIQEDGLMEDYSGAVGRSAFRNCGTMYKSGGTSTFTLVRFHNPGGTIEAQSGTMYFYGGYDQSAGITRLAGGNISANSTITINGGMLAGTGTVNATVSSSGTVSPGLSVGILNIGGNYSQGGSGALTIKVGGRTVGTAHDRLAVSGSASLNGTLNVVLTNAFVPALTDSFTIVICGSRSGNFSSTNASALGADRRWYVGYSNTAVYLLWQGITASLTSPTNGTVYTAPGSVTLSATITDTAGTVTQVSFYVDGSLAGNSSSSTNPYTLTWSATAGSHTLASYAWDNVGLMATSTAVSVIVAPDAPTGVAAGKGTYTNKVLVAWNSVSGATGYQVWRNTENSSGTAALLDGTTGTNYNDTGAPPGALYYYWVKATNTVAISLFSSSDSGYRALTAPAGVTASEGTYTDKVAIAWSASVGADGYTIWRNTSDNSGGASSIGSASGVTAFNDSGTAANATNYYWVKATNTVGSSGFSSSAAGWRGASPVTHLDPPTHVSASDGTYTGKVTITWSAVTGAAGYEIWNSDINSIGTAANLGRSTTTTYDDASAGARSGLMKYYWLRAWNTAATGAFSAVDSGYALPETGAEIISGQPAIGDYDGDALADPAVYHLNSGRFYAWISSAYYSLLEPAIQCHVESGEIPAFGDYDGDGYIDPGVFRAPAGTWYVWLSSAGYYRIGPVLFGIDVNDIPVAADYDGDGKTDPGVYHGAEGAWYVWLSSGGYTRLGPLTQFSSSAADIPVPGDYDGDRLADPAVYQSSGGTWYLWMSGSGYAPLGPVTFATSTAHLTVPADYDGDRKCDPATYMPTLGKWRMWMSGSGYALTEMELK